MFRYLALLFDPQQEIQRQAAQQVALDLSLQEHWSQVLAQPGLQVWCTPPESPLGIHVLADSSGVILGKLFERPGDPFDPSVACCAQLNARSAHRIVQSRGDTLVHDFWGNYVAILYDAREAVTRIVKDPTGPLPCYYAQHRGLVVVFSVVEDCRLVGLPRFTIGEGYLRARVMSDGGDRTVRALNEVTTVCRGEWHTFAHRSGMRQVQRGFAWSPQSFTQRASLLESPALAAKALNATVRSCTRSWASCYPSALLRLSGGLDSTIMAACLAESPVQWSSYTYYNPCASGDERAWARLAARYVGVPLREIAIDPRSADLSTLELLGPTVEPIATLEYVQRSPLERRLAAQYAIDAIFTGMGGDSVFAGDAVALAVSEYLRYHGVTPRVLALARDVAHHAQLSVATVMSRALRRWLRGARMHEQQLARLQTLVNPQLRDASGERAEYPHPWFAGLTDIPWSTVRRLGSLTDPPQFYPADASAQSVLPPIVSPLYAQPVVELCLRIPLYTHFDKGVERGLARRAFAAVLPKAICERQWKDRAPKYLAVLIADNLDFLRECLLEGVLMRARLLDRQAVEAALSRAPARSDTLPGELLHHLDIELWARHWIA